MEIIRILISSFIIIGASWTVGWIGFYLRTKASEKSDINVLKVPKLVFWIGFVGLMICYIVIAILLAVAFNEVNAACSICLFLMSFLYLWLIMYALNWKVVIEEDGFTFRNMFRKTCKFSYSEITALKRIKIGGYKIYVGKKRITVDYYIVGHKEFWDKLKYLNIKSEQ